MSKPPIGFASVMFTADPVKEMVFGVAMRVDISRLDGTDGWEVVDQFFNFVFVHSEKVFRHFFT